MTFFKKTLSTLHYNAVMVMNKNNFSTIIMVITIVIPFVFLMIQYLMITKPGDQFRLKATELPIEALARLAGLKFHTSSLVTHPKSIEIY